MTETARTPLEVILREIFGGGPNFHAMAQKYLTDAEFHAAIRVVMAQREEIASLTKENAALAAKLRAWIDLSTSEDKG